MISENNEPPTHREVDTPMWPPAYESDFIILEKYLWKRQHYAVL